MKNTTEMRERLLAARAVLRGKAVAAVPVSVQQFPVFPQMQYGNSGNMPIRGSFYTTLERWRPHE